MARRKEKCASREAPCLLVRATPWFSVSSVLKHYPLPHGPRADPPPTARPTQWAMRHRRDDKHRPAGVLRRDDLRFALLRFPVLDHAKNRKEYSRAGTEVRAARRQALAAAPYAIVVSPVKTLSQTMLSRHNSSPAEAEPVGNHVGRCACRATALTSPPTARRQSAPEHDVPRRRALLPVSVQATL